jgi:DNA polymerase elongation subunit (family B)
VTGENPPPMELELEKVYQPCMMVSKKRWQACLHTDYRSHVHSYITKHVHFITCTLL